MKQRHSSIWMVFAISFALVCCSFSVAYAASSLDFTELKDGTIYPRDTSVSVKNPDAAQHYGLVVVKNDDGSYVSSTVYIGSCDLHQISVGQAYIRLNKLCVYDNVGMVTLFNNDKSLRCVVLTAEFSGNTATGTLAYPMNGAMHITTFTSSNIKEGKALSAQITALNNSVYTAKYENDYIAAGEMYYKAYYLFLSDVMVNITLPTQQQGFSIVPTEGSVNTFEAGSDYSFSLSLADGYEKSPEFAVKANGVALTDNAGVYTLTQPLEDQTITVEGVVAVSAPTTSPAAPTGAPGSPATGDGFQFGLWICLLAGALVLGSGVIFFALRKKAN